MLRGNCLAVAMLLGIQDTLHSKKQPLEEMLHLHLNVFTLKYFGGWFWGLFGGVFGWFGLVSRKGFTV